MTDHEPVYGHPDGYLVTACDLHHPYITVTCDWPTSEDAERLAPIIAEFCWDCVGGQG